MMKEYDSELTERVKKYAPGTGGGTRLPACGTQYGARKLYGPISCRHCAVAAGLTFRFRS